ncbi:MULTISPECIES: serine hydrolase domain-containing protein [Flavobacterium]|uniref:serine hydrolase domain-containing protein n=1 Tax=Flavobacterium TaxID=237 RepID=UPI001FCC100A|nr:MULTISPECIES: serine hydrolase domain-containing protein [Flavobacterium]UOK43663.1 beta-lactamase family protein [Flavobacterium enshiense]
MSTKLHRYFLAQIILAVSLYCSAQSSTKLTRSLDSLVNSEMQKQNFPGLSLAVVRDGKIEYVKGYGFSNIEHQVPVKPETIFQSGSLGKQFAAFAVMLLVEDGKMTLDDRLTKYFPDAPAEWNAITIKNLLTHTSGFGEYTDGFDLKKDYTEDNLYRIFREKPLKFAPGEKSDYSNMGYATLGIIISKVTGDFYGNFLKQRIFDPLGMSTARVISESDIIVNRAAGYRMVNGEIKNQEWVSPSVNSTADGSLYLTALDMAKWEAGLNAGKLLKRESYEAIFSPVKLNDGTTFPYGFGWRINTLNGKRIFDHDGTWQGFESTIIRYPEKKITVIVFANLIRTNTNRIAKRTMELYQPELKITKLKPIKDNEPKVTALVKDFVTRVIEKTLVADMFTPELGAEFIPQSEKTSAYLKKQVIFNGLELLDRKNLDSKTRMYHYRLHFSKESIEILVTLTKNNKISGIEGR